MAGKRERFWQAVEQWGPLRCACGRELLRSGDDLRCASGHTVNVNRKGCVNLLSRQTEGCYDAKLFAARGRVFAAGCYDAVADAIDRVLPAGAIRLLDAGCGDGWYLDRLLTGHPERCGMGLDISRDAIAQATDHPSPAVWCVADLCRLPVMDHTLDAVLDILTPAGYAEFARVLKPDGVLIKVYPGSEYLKEIRAVRGLPLYEEGRVDAFLREKADVLSSERVTVTHPVDAALWADFVRMTPLDQDLTDEEKERLCAIPAETVTVDLYVTCARLKSAQG